MTGRNEWKSQEILDLHTLITRLYRKAHIYVSKATEKELSNSLSFPFRCYKCHTLLPAENPSNTTLVIKDGMTLKGICSLCLENLTKHNGHMLTCEGCNQSFHQLYTHHWYDPATNDTLYTRQICQFCNSRLSARNLWKPHNHKELPDHFLPNWDLQLLYLSSHRTDDDYECLRNELYPWSIITTLFASVASSKE